MTLANRYKEQDKHFIAYLSNSFYYEFGRVIFKTTKEITTHEGVKAYLDIADANLTDYRDDIDYKLDKILGYETEDNCLTDKWTKETFNEGDSYFYVLTSREKRFIKLYYQENIADIEISRISNCHLNTVNVNKRIGIKKLCDLYKINYIRTRRITGGV